MADKFHDDNNQLCYGKIQSNVNGIVTADYLSYNPLPDCSSVTAPGAPSYLIDNSISSVEKFINTAKALKTDFDNLQDELNGEYSFPDDMDNALDKYIPLLEDYLDRLKQGV